MLQSDEAFPGLPAVQVSGESLGKLITEAKYSGRIRRINADINSKNFPGVGVRRGLVLVDPISELGLRGWFNTDTLLAALSRQNYEPATMWELIHYAKTMWDRNDVVVALGSVGSGSRVGVLWVCDDQRELELISFEGRWNSDFSFLEVRK